MSEFDDLFVLELANNHLGRLKRGLDIVSAFKAVVEANRVRAAIKLQFRDVSTFIHKHHRWREDSRYIKKVGATELSWTEQQIMVEAIRAAGLETMATPFDEISVDKCVEFGVDYLKIASSDIRDRSLLAKIAATGKPVVASSGGATLSEIDGLVNYFQAAGVPFALNHCVSIYPSEDGELELNQIDLLRDRYPDITIGFSSHEKADWRISIAVAYGKGARTFERHIDIESDGVLVSPYCTLPHQADDWFKAYNRAKEMCGGDASHKRRVPEKEIRYLDELVRGVYAKDDVAAGDTLTRDRVYFAAPLLHGQISVREYLGSEILTAPVTADAPIKIDDIDSDYSSDHILRRLIEDRALPHVPADSGAAPRRAVAK
jgi:N-acetylneuraminate synthase